MTSRLVLPVSSTVAWDGQVYEKDENRPDPIHHGWTLPLQNGTITINSLTDDIALPAGRLHVDQRVIKEDLWSAVIMVIVDYLDEHQVAEVRGILMRATKNEKQQLCFPFWVAGSG